MPTDKICLNKLQKKNPEFCSVRYRILPNNMFIAVKIDENLDLNKLKIKDLKKILTDNNVVYNDCIEKTGIALNSK